MVYKLAKNSRLMRLSEIFLHMHMSLRNLNHQERVAGPLSPDVVGDMKKKWANELLDLMDVEVITTGAPAIKGPGILIGNHISYLDIPLVFQSTNSVFLAKREVIRWPIVGRAGKSMGTIFVDRKCRSSRKRAGFQISEQAIQNNKSVVIFPAATTTIDDGNSWRVGAFRIANEFNLKVQPFRIWYEPIREAAYIDRDVFSFHLYSLLAQKNVRAYIDFHEPVNIDDPIPDMNYWQNWCRDSSFRAQSQ